MRYVHIGRFFLNSLARNQRERAIFRPVIWLVVVPLSAALLVAIISFLGTCWLQLRCGNSICAVSSSKGLVEILIYNRSETNIVNRNERYWAVWLPRWSPVPQTPSTV